MENSYYKRRGTESACQCCCTEKKDCTTSFPIPGIGKDLGYLTVREKKLEKIGSYLSLFVLLTLLTPSRIANFFLFYFILVREQDSCPYIFLN